MTPTSYEIINQSENEVTYKDQDGFLYTIQATADDNLDAIILGK